MEIHDSEIKVCLIGSSGYVGSFLFEQLENLLKERLIGIDPRQTYATPNRIRSTHQELASSFFADFDVVLFFGGVSSVGQANSNPSDAFRENTLGLHELFLKLSPKTKLIYASSASVYSQGQRPQTASSEDDPVLGNSNSYDATKLAGELSLIGQPGCSHTGLRMGTVSGVSPSMRWDLVFNAMVRSATEQGVVRVSNPEAHRSILFLTDLLGSLIGLMNRADDPPRILNLASHSSTIGELGREIAEILGAKVLTEDSSPTYDFLTDMRLSRTISTIGELDFNEEVRKLSRAIQKKGGVH
jgi:nucleoside-diphosphate-sugar epimerase